MFTRRNPDILVRRLIVADAPELTQLRRDQREFFRPFEPARTDAWYTVDAQEHDLADEHTHRLGIYREDGSSLIGWVTISGIEMGAFRSCHIGYAVAQEDNGRGLATTAIGMAVEIAFEDLELHRVQAAVLPTNTASMRVLEKNGFRLEGLAHRYLHLDGAWRDHVIWAITSD